MNKKILHLAIPAIITNITIPLLGLIDMAIVGHLGSPIYIDAISVGSTLLNLIYWNFGFLRMGNSGLASSAYGRRDFTDSFQFLVRSICLAIIASIMILIFHSPFLNIIFSFFFLVTEI